MTLAGLAARLGLPEAGAERLLAAAAALDLVERRGVRWGLGPLGAAMVGNQAVVSMVAHHRMLYADLADPVALFRGEGGQGSLHRYWAYAGGGAPGAEGGARLFGSDGRLAAAGGRRNPRRL